MKPIKKRSIGRPRSDEQKKPTNEIILQAATKLFLANGYKEVSIDDVAESCNVTKATVYYYYSSKAELFTETIVQMMLRIRGHMQAILQQSIPLRTRLLEVAKAQLRATVEIDVEGFMRETKNALSTEQVSQVQKAEENMLYVLEQAFIDAIEAGEIDKVNATFATHSFISLVKVGNYRSASNEPIFPTVEETAEQIIHFFWNGLFQANN
ncbi:AcrR family transcriptional regulator [Salirhabdus euzebyi]|uniref:AcrR family transcriptional regulator n=1 Tax=Salirhabdus euzebyi TaxID=394506 RepID=A0A841Q407_9BACI|nr:TetR/AcrR family transcriptional regulator [Salirhabdus euzebyi]MBB6453149.1 AcrR family transcriptional regulator [Salirhabdus euzebyi]